ncbi:MAG TPA: TRAM domain-containing protein [bacterium]|nr:TRAM domain-containing protein [bacterium]
MSGDRLHRLRVVDVAGRDGVARLEGRVVFVPGTVPGDTALVEITRQTRDYSHGRVVELLEGGEGRVEPACEIFGRCGGCDWLHIAHPVQLRLKGKLTADLARKNARLDIEPPPVEPSEPFCHRAVARLQVARHSGEPELGYYVRGSHELVAWDACPLLMEPLNTAVGAVRKVLRTGIGGDWSGLFEVTVERAAGGWALTLGFDRSAPPGTDWSAPAGELPGLVALRVKGKNFSTAAWGGERFETGSLASPLVKTPGVFRQPNDAGARWLHARMTMLCGELKPEVVWDLYGGGGPLGSTALAGGARLWLVEADPLGAADAEENLSRSGWDFRVAAGTVERALVEGPDAPFERPDLVILDPPRTGLSREVTDALNTLKPPLIAYVSCNPARFWRDAALFIRGGYELEGLAAFDMLPQTPGLELVGIFR